MEIKSLKRIASPKECWIIEHQVCEMFFVFTFLHMEAYY